MKAHSNCFWASHLTHNVKCEPYVIVFFYLQDNSEYFIQETNYFPNITALLEYYTKNKLPNKLTEIYTTYYNVNNSCYVDLWFY